jgi:hypothetical protein
LKIILDAGCLDFVHVAGCRFLDCRSPGMRQTTGKQVKAEEPRQQMLSCQMFLEPATALFLQKAEKAFTPGETAPRARGIPAVRFSENHFSNRAATTGD